MEAAELAETNAGFRLGEHRMGIGDICFPLLKVPLIKIGILAIPVFVLIIILLYWSARRSVDKIEQLELEEGEA